VWIKVTLPQRVEAGVLAPSTLDGYRDIVEKHVAPHLGRVRTHRAGWFWFRSYISREAIMALVSGRTAIQASAAISFESSQVSDICPLGLPSNAKFLRTRPRTSGDITVTIDADP
jgi:hypothetical protein